MEGHGSTPLYQEIRLNPLENFNLGAVIGLNITSRCGGWGMGEEDDKPPDWQIRCGAQKVNVNLRGQERVQTADYLLNLYNKKEAGGKGRLIRQFSIIQ